MYNARRTLEHLIRNGADGDMTEDERKSADGLGVYRDKFIAAMDDDLNTADAIAAVFELISEVNGVVKDGATKAYAQAALDELLELTHVLGLLEQEDGAAAQDGGGAGASGAAGADDDLQSLIDERAQARADKDWARADEIRDELAARGITLKDTPQGVQIIRS
jgi:cysteinyl-tRNA synthetase